MEPLQSQGSMTDRATSALRSAILRGDLEPNTLHAVHTVAESLGVSRTPVREALIRLAAEGMVRVQRNRGFVVLRHSPRDLVEIFSLRLLLEVPATRAAASLATPDDVAALDADIARMRDAMAADDAELFLREDRQFHRTLLSISGNERLTEFVDSLRNVVLSSGVSTANRTESIGEILEPHLELLRLVRDGKPTEAAASMHEHLVSTGHKLLTQEFGDEAAASFADALGAYEA
ncbi:GntR family transcriptional regulator [Nocardioides sp. 503]|uniref:GntR family transcriptional regulator n=1 Tax=Nocardioides sp. 503 TaxID=2508326 RepID=UPI00106F1427|nr:GntR family transcriptional regulator [Nocardioides sp. 503]